MKSLKAFTLLELLFATAIISMLFVSINLGLQLSRRTSTVNKHREEALIYLQSVLERLKAINYDTMVATYKSVPPNYNWGTTDNLFTALNIYVEIGSLYGLYNNSARIITRIKWKEYWGKNYSEQLETIRYRDF